MDYVAGILVALFGLFGVVLTLLGFSGVWLPIVVALLVEWWRTGAQFHVWTIVGVGTPIMPIIGTIAGAALGAGLGAAILERTKDQRTWGDVWRVGQGAAIGRLIATIIKTALAAAAAVWLAVAYWV